MLEKTRTLIERKARSLFTKSAANNPIAEQQMQRSLVNQYKLALAQGHTLYDDISDAGFRCYSEYEEDGIILYLLSLVGTPSRVVVEMCCGDGKVCMATNLILNHGFTGHLFDGDKDNVDQARQFFASQADGKLTRPRVNHAWITRANADELIKTSGATGEVDLLSLDLDGIDYYVWEAIESISPRVCVFETHNVIPSDLSLTIPYQDDFYAWDKPAPEVDFRSVSLSAMQKLSAAKGYTLVGAHRYGFNVFFVRNDLLGDHLYSGP